jgi:hypothetical protein
MYQPPNLFLWCTFQFVSLPYIHVTKSGILFVLTVVSLPGNHLLHKPVPRRLIIENMREVSRTFAGVRLH